MGIKGFTKFIEDRTDLYFENYELRDCNLIIDGHSISCQLYNWNHWQFDARSNNSYGGDYDKYAYIVENFFGMLKEVKVTPIVIFDGGFEQRKLPTILKRMQDKIKIADQLNPQQEKKQPYKVIFPLLLRETFKDVLRNLDIKMVMCKYEGDTEIASIAKILNCPVLTFDSDYFLFGAQYIPFKTLNNKVRAIENWRMGTYKCITCKIYKIEKFLQDFDGLQENSLYLLPVLMGNDYINQKIFNKFLESIDMLNKNVQEQIQGILNWLSSETTEAAIRKILGNFKTVKERQNILMKIEKIMSGYYYVESRLLKYLSISPKSEYKQKNFDFTLLKEDITKEPEYKGESNSPQNSVRDSGNEGIDINKGGASGSENSEKDVKGYKESEKIKNGNLLPLQEEDATTSNNNEPNENSDSSKDKDYLTDADSNVQENGIAGKDSENKLESDSQETAINFEENDEEMPSSYTLDLQESNLEKENASENTVTKIFLKNFIKCQYPSSFMDILTQNKYYCIPQMENHLQEHSHAVSLEILCAIHKILTSSANSDFTVVARGEGTSIKWFSQEKFTVPVPSLEEIEQLTLQGRRDVLLKILNIDSNFVSLLAHFPTEWHTFLIALKYAVGKTSFETPFIYSIVLCFINLNYVDQRIGYYRSVERYKNKFYSYMQTLPQTSEHIPFRVDKNCFYYFPSKDCFLFMQKVVHLFTVNPKETVEMFDKNLLHSMAQIQSVLLHIKYLNSLLKCPYPNLVMHQIFNGTFIYNATKTFQKKSTELQNTYLNVFFKDCPSIFAGLKYVLNLLSKQIIL